MFGQTMVCAASVLLGAQQQQGMTTIYKCRSPSTTRGPMEQTFRPGQMMSAAPREVCFPKSDNMISLDSCRGCVFSAWLVYSCVMQRTPVHIAFVAFLCVQVVACGIMEAVHSDLPSDLSPLSSLSQHGCTDREVHVAAGTGSCCAICLFGAHRHFIQPVVLSTNRVDRPSLYIPQSNTPASSRLPESRLTERGPPPA